MARLVPLLLIIAFTVYTLVDCLQSESAAVRNLPKSLWLVLIFFFPILGPGSWLIAGRPRAQSGPAGPARRGPIGPDDDPDFLRGL